jgi:hypothetical protein
LHDDTENGRTYFQGSDPENKNIYIIKWASHANIPFKKDKFNKE